MSVDALMTWNCRTSSSGARTRRPFGLAMSSQRGGSLRTAGLVLHRGDLFG